MKKIGNFIDDTISVFSPEKAARRAKSRVVFENIRSYEASNRDRTRVFRNFGGQHANVNVQTSGKIIRELARELDENNDIAGGILNVLVANIVGVGIKPEPQIKNKKGELLTEINKKILELFYLWCKSPEATNSLNWSKCQRIACRSWLRDGEVFARLLTGNIAGLKHSSKIPFSIELLEADMLPLDFNEQSKNIISSIELDGWNCPKYYWLYEKQPNDVFLNMQVLPSVKIKADEIVHLKLHKRIGQLRGVSVFANFYRRLDDLRDYEDAERIAARIGASISLYRKRGEDEGNMPVDKQEPDIGMMPMPIEKGMIFDIANDAEMGMFDTKRPNSNMEAFINLNLRSMASGAGASYSSISKNYNGTYSAQRQEMVEQQQIYAGFRDEFIASFYEPIWREFVKMVFLSNGLGNRLDIDMESIYDADFRGSNMPWIDPQKEAKADLLAVSAGFKSKSQVIRERGRNPEEVENEIQTERVRAKEKDLVFESDYANIIEPKVVNDNELEEGKNGE